MEKLTKEEMVLLEVIGHFPEYTVYRCDSHGIFARRSKDDHTCFQCKNKALPLDIATSIHHKRPAYLCPTWLKQN